LGASTSTWKLVSSSNDEKLRFFPLGSVAYCLDEKIQGRVYSSFHEGAAESSSILFLED
jgi:hypothetical protein